MAKKKGDSAPFEIESEDSNFITPASELVEVVPIVNGGVTQQHPDWSDKVLVNCVEQELTENGLVLTDGLRRAVESLIGPILSMEAELLTPANVIPTKENGTNVVAKVRLKILVVDNDNYALEHGPYERVVEDVGEVSFASQDTKFLAFSASTAVTRAEARALRKALRLRKVLAVDEIAESKIEEIKTDGPISDAQKTAITQLVKRIPGFSMEKFLAASKRKPTSIGELTKNEAISTLRILNDFQANRKDFSAYTI